MLKIDRTYAKLEKKKSKNKRVSNKVRVIVESFWLEVSCLTSYNSSDIAGRMLKIDRTYAKLEKKKSKNKRVSNKVRVIVESFWLEVSCLISYNSSDTQDVDL